MLLCNIYIVKPESGPKATIFSISKLVIIEVSNLDNYYHFF